jgi:hypothetical protein
MQARRRWVAVAAALVVLAVPASAGAATQIGQTFTPTGGGTGPGVTMLQSTSPLGQYAAPLPGVITSWSYEAALSVPQLKFKVARPAGPDTFMIVGEDGPRTPTAGTLNTFTTQIPVQAGDVIGLHVVTAGLVVRAGGGAYFFQQVASDPPPGTTTTFTPAVTSAQIDVSATLEPDADRDGFGDETQDCDPTDPARAEDCAPPETTITSGPKNVVKTKKKRAKVTFTFASSEPGMFECSLDGAPFTPCSSPSTHKVKAGRRKPKEHTFQVRAIDAAGNPDPAPAADDFKAKRKK